MIQVTSWATSRTEPTQYLWNSRPGYVEMWWKTVVRVRRGDILFAYDSSEGPVFCGILRRKHRN